MDNTTLRGGNEMYDGQETRKRWPDFVPRQGQLKIAQRFIAGYAV
jgi:hypothetical protein